ncbi:hypothetical protein SDJN03_26689, partial [Cucurbita argyrosperma subsp. sororia]
MAKCWKWATLFLFREGKKGKRKKGNRGNRNGRLKEMAKCGFLWDNDWIKGEKTRLADLGVESFQLLVSPAPSGMNSSVSSSRATSSSCSCIGLSELQDIFIVGGV